MKRNILNIALVTVALAAAALTSCKENELDPKKAGEGRKISFAISEANTRTEYDATDNLQINWTEGDKVRIYCAEAEDDVKDAEYTVSQISKNTGKLVYNAEGLAWGGDDLVHNFYAVYPSDTKMIAGVTDGKVTVNANLNQMCTIEKNADGTYKKDANGMYNTVPDMSNAVMVANLSTKPVDEVALTFKPIMTTLEIIVRGKSTGETATDNIGTDITGISINMDASAYGASSKQFIYDINAGEIVRGDLNSSVQFFVGIKGADGSNSLHLNTNESVKLTAFLPPVTVDGNHKIQIRVHATGSTELVATIGGTMKDGSVLEIAQSSKRKITLPWIKKENLSNNNWITPLDDNIYVSQLSIPGTHDAGTGEGMMADGIGQVQEIGISEQLNMGIRAFDFRPAWKKSSLMFGSESAMWIWHGMSVTNISFDKAIGKIVSYIDANPGEFAIVQMRHENEEVYLKDTNKWADDIINNLNKVSDHIVEWKPNLTIGQCRGKIIILTRADYNGRSRGALVSQFPENRICGWFTEDDIVDKGTIQSTTNSSGHPYIDTEKRTTLSLGSDSTPYYVQDYYKTGNDNGTTKIALVKSMLKATFTFCENRDRMNYWALNHTSGYTGTLSMTDDYRGNAQNVNPIIYNYITGSEYTPGPMGIVFLDFVGARTSGSYTVYGDLLPQAIIDNNYKYHMLREGEKHE